MQFTGLHDKNGKETFEKDVVRAKVDHPTLKGVELTGVVEFINGCFSFVFSKNRAATIPLPLCDLESFEKIGNAFQNPELLQP